MHRSNRLARALVPVLILLYVLQCAWFIRTQSFAMDEPWHIVAGLEALRFGEFERWQEHPPLARMFLVLPLLAKDVGYGMLDTTVRPLHPAPEQWLYPTRAMNVLLGVSLLLLLWFTACRLFSEGAATFVLGLAVFSSELVAHFSLAMNDGAAALSIFAVAVQWIRWRSSPTRGRLVSLGLLLGAMLLTKFSTPPMFLLVLALVLFAGPEALRWRPAQWSWRPAITLAVVAFLVVWAGYLFHISKVKFADGNVNIHFSGYTPELTYPLAAPRLTVFLPACEYLTGFGWQVDHNQEGHPNFFLGRVSPDAGSPFYFPVAALLKWPPLTLLLAGAGVFLLLRRRTPAGSELVWMGVLPAIYLAFAILSRINIGIRHLLPVYPFLLLYAAATWEWARARGGRKMLLVLAALVLLQAADTLRYAPDYLSYFTPFVKPSQTYRLLTDSNLDWGQGLIALRDYQAAHPRETLHLAYFGVADPAMYGIRYVPLPEGERATGTVVVSATNLSGQLLSDPAAYHWLLAYPVKAILNHSLYVFEVPGAGH